MTRAALRVLVGVLMALATAVVLSQLLPSAGAQIAGALARPPQVPQTVTLPTLPRPTTTTSAPPFVTTPPTAPPTPSTTATTRAPTRPRSTASTTSTSTTSTSTTTTTVAPLPAAAPPPVTLPLATAAQSGHINAFFSILSVLGLLCCAGLFTAQWFLTKPGNKGPTL